MFLFIAKGNRGENLESLIVSVSWQIVGVWLQPEIQGGFSDHFVVKLVSLESEVHHVVHRQLIHWLELRILHSEIGGLKTKKHANDEICIAYLSSRQKNPAYGRH